MRDGLCRSGTQYPFTSSIREPHREMCQRAAEYAGQ